jgi:hypothetical protein
LTSEEVTIGEDVEKTIEELKANYPLVSAILDKVPV